MSLATLNGNTCTRVRVQAGSWGCWWADAKLDAEVALSGAATLALADKTLVGTIVSGGAAHGSAAYRIVGGKGGWHKLIKAKTYHDDAGVKVATIASDLARECGEIVADVSTDRRGPHYERSADLASAALNEIAPRGWYVDFGGATHIGARYEATYAGDAARTRVDPAPGIVELATETIGNLEPGVRVDGSSPATDVEYLLDAQRLTVRIYHSAPASRRIEALRRIIAALDPRAKFRGCFDFRVVTQDGERLNLQPVRTGLGFGDLARVPVRPGMAGLRARVQLGEIVVVTFADGDPSRPQVIAHDAPDSPGWMPLELDLGDEPRLGVARLTDAVICGPLGGTITHASTRVKAGL